MPVDPAAFVAAMERRIQTYDPHAVVSAALRNAWREMVGVFNTQLVAPSSRWPVIPAELGVGKTTAVKVFCTLLQDDPGVLIVVRTKEQAEKYAREINAWSGRPMAFAHHSGLSLAERRNLDVLPTHPVLVVCHKAYETGLDDFAVDVSRAKFEKMHRYAGARQQRALVFIDEALDQVHEARVRRDVLKELLSRMPHEIKRTHPGAMRVIESVNRALREAPEAQHRALTAQELLALTTFTPEEADAELLAMWEHGLRRAKNVEPKLRARFGETLTALRRHLGAYRWTAGDGVRTALSGSRLLLLPPGTHGVVLDATGRLNNVYMGRPEEFSVRQMRPVRDYSKVTIFDSRTSRTGKWAADESLAKDTIDAVLAHYGESASERRVVVVVAERGEQHFKRLGPAAGFKAFATAHWNAIDGRNDWSEFDTLVIATLNYGTKTMDLSTFMAVHGRELDDATLNDPPDEVRTIRENRIAAQLAQAMGRIRLRRMAGLDAAHPDSVVGGSAARRAGAAGTVRARQAPRPEADRGRGGVHEGGLERRPRVPRRAAGTPGHARLCRWPRRAPAARAGDHQLPGDDVRPPVQAAVHGRARRTELGSVRAEVAARAARRLGAGYNGGVRLLDGEDPLAEPRDPRANNYADSGGLNPLVGG